MLITTYDPVLHEKIFILKGEEDYARSTDTILNVVEFDDSYNHINYMRIGLEMNVLRDIGESSLVLYDNDEVLRVIPWSDTPSTMTFDEDLTWDDENQLLKWGIESDTDTGLKLAYDIDHNFYVKYMGNKKCLKSESKKHYWNVPTPSAYESSISYVSPQINWVSGSTVSLSIKLNTSEYVSSTSRDIKVYDGSTLLDTVSVTPNEASTISLSGLSDGKHTIRCIFNGDEEATSCQKDLDISVGFITTLVSHTEYGINTQQVSCTGKVVNYLGNGVSGVKITCTDDNDDLWSSEYATTNSSGVATVSTNLINTSETFNCVMHTSINNVEIGSVEYDIISYGNVTLSLTKSPTDGITVPNNQITLTANITGCNDPLPVVFSGAVSSTVQSNNGSAVVRYTGTGAGDDTVTATFSGATTSTSISDLIQYWKAGDSRSNPSYIGTGVLSAQTNGWKLKDGQVGFGLGTSDFREDYILEFDVVSINSHHSFTLGVHNGSAVFLGEPIVQNLLSNNSHVTITKNGNTGEVKVGNNTILSIDYSGYQVDYYAPFIVCPTLQSNVNLIINNLKWKRV